MKKPLLSCFCCIEALARRPETAVYKQLVGLALAERCSHTLSSCLFENCHLIFPALDDFPGGGTAIYGLYRYVPL